MRTNCADLVEHCVVLSVCVSSRKRFVVVIAGRRTTSDFIRFPNVLRSIRAILLYFVIGRRKRKQCNKIYNSQLVCLRRLRCPRCDPRVRQIRRTIPAYCCGKIPIQVCYSTQYYTDDFQRQKTWLRQNNKTISKHYFKLTCRLEIYGECTTPSGVNVETRTMFDKT